MGNAIIKAIGVYIKFYDIPESATSTLFILMTRFCFNHLYSKYFAELLFKFDSTEFVNRIAMYRKISLIGFGFCQEYFPDNYLSLPLDHIPDRNPYSEAISLFQQLQFQVSPCTLR